MGGRTSPLGAAGAGAGAGASAAHNSLIGMSLDERLAIADPIVSKKVDVGDKVDVRMQRLLKEREASLKDFKSVRRTATGPSKSMMQVLQTRAKFTALRHAQATAAHEQK